MPDSLRDGLYDADFYAWTRQQAEALRRMASGGAIPGAADGLDLERLAEEIEDLGKEQLRALKSDLTRVIEHLIKLRHSPARDPRNAWRRSVREHRIRIDDRIHDDHIRDGRRLGNALADVLPLCWRDGRELAVGSLADEDGIDPAVVPETCPWTLDRILDRAWFPDDTGG